MSTRASQRCSVKLSLRSFLHSFIHATDTHCVQAWEYSSGQDRNKSHFHGVQTPLDKKLISRETSKSDF